MKLNTARRFWNSATQCLFGAIGVAALTWVCYRLHLNLATAALLYLIVILLLSLTGSFASPALVSILAVLCLHYVFGAPLFSFGRVGDPVDAVALIAFLTTAFVISRLITKVRRSLTELQAANQQRRLVIETIPAYVWTALPDGSVDFLSQRLLEYHGLSLEDARGWSWEAAFHPEDVAGMLAKWRAALAAGVPYEHEIRVRRADGEYRWFVIRAVPLRDELGTVVKWYGTATDVEDRKRAAEALEAQARLLDLTHDAVFVRDMNDVITYWNRGAEEQYGWTREEALGQVTRRLLQTRFPLPFDEITATLLHADRWSGELVHTRRDGSQLIVASRWSLQRDESGRPVGILETNNDVSQRKRAEDALRRSETYLAEAQRLSHTGSWAWDVARRENLFWSVEHHRIFGLDLQPSPPSFGAARDRVHPEDRPRFDEALDKAIRERAELQAEFRVLLPDGSVRHVHSVGYPVVNGSGEVVELVGTVMDVTERKRAERAVRRARERALEARFAAVLDERTRLARDIHDTLLQGFTGVALKLLAAIGRVTGPPETVAALRELVGLAQKTLTDARHAVWDLRSPALAGHDFPAALRTAAEDGVRGTGLTLEFEVGGTPRQLGPDIEAVVARVMQEAIANVVKHAAARTVQARLSYERRAVRLSVIDDGQGFAVDPDLHAYGGHWGLLGMRERASQVRGKLSVRSTPGHGTEIVLLVPYAISAGSPPQPASAASPP